MTQPQNVAAILGVGPGLGTAVARHFATNGYAVGLMARGLHNLAPVAEAIEAEGGTALVLPTDATDPESVAASFAKLRHDIGNPSVFIYNAGAFQMTGLLETSPEDFERCWKVNCFGAFLALQHVLPAMVAKERGTVILTGATAALRGSARFSCLAVGKFGLRALAQSAAREFGPQGVHVAHVIVDGQIASHQVHARDPDRAAHTLLDPAAIAQTYWHLHSQDRTAWTLEVDLRPAVEKF